MIQIAQNSVESEIENSSLAEHYLQLACDKLPVVKRVIDRFGDYSLADYLEVFSPQPAATFQSTDDLLNVVGDYTEELLGPGPAARVTADLASTPVVLTANHHGIDYFAQSIQGTLIFSLLNFAKNSTRTTVPVFSCGNIPLDNLTYPRGILLYKVGDDHLEQMPKKIPIFSDRQKRCVVSAAPAFDRDMIKRAASRLAKMVNEKVIADDLEIHLRQIFEQDYDPICLMGLESYSRQSVLVNNRIWRRLFSNSVNVPELVYLELEKVVSRLLQIDLHNDKSLASIVLFDPKVCNAVLYALDGEPACWDLDTLQRRFNVSGPDTSSLRAINGCGSCLFWGIDSAGRKIPLSLEDRDGNLSMLRGIDDRGNLWEMNYDPETICAALADNLLLPSLFTCFLTLSFARGLACPGGYFKDEYVPRMQKGLVYALRSLDGFEDIALSVEGLVTESYLSGMLAVLSGVGDGLVPSGPLEIIAGGGFDQADIEKIMTLTVREAHIAGLFETVQDVVPRGDMLRDWKKHIARDCMELLEDRVVVK